MNHRQSGPSFSESEIRLVLLGRTGAGKSATGNTILGSPCFESELSMSSVTKTCQKKSGNVQGRRLTLIDTPGWFDTSLKEKELEDEVLRCLTMCSPGPHAFLLVIPIARFTKEHQETLDLIKMVFQENITQHTIIVFTRADELQGKTIEHFISRQDETIRDVIKRFGGHYLAFNNSNPENQDQVTRLLHKLDRLMERNKNRYFTNRQTQMIESTLTVLDQNSTAIADGFITIAKEEISQKAKQDYANILNTFKEEMQRMKRNMERVQKKIHRSNTERKAYYRRLNRKKMMIAEKKFRAQKRELELWVSNENERIVQELRERALNDDPKFSLLKIILAFSVGAVAGAGAGAGAAYTWFSAPVGLVAQLTTLVGPEVAQVLSSAITSMLKMSKFSSFAKCSIQ